ncbi:MAG: GNAT family acetyltransferase [Ectothiorhodospiraceae bacterium]|nr:GNAT family acetyltransferase [Ectothiorhodospiraceae bacterium]MCH8505443.1 GNAT family acetyltransferase [Ectothiorhodospiraceae bacterium]
MNLRAFERSDEEAIIALWERCGLTRPWNDPRKDIARKLSEQPELFLVGTQDGELIASVMAGFDGHRGWVYYLAVAPEHQRRSHGRTLMAEVERRLHEIGCPKINLMVRATNADVQGFYRSLGYIEEDVVNFGRRLSEDAPPLQKD